MHKMKGSQGYKARMDSPYTQQNSDGDASWRGLARPLELGLLRPRLQWCRRVIDHAHPLAHVAPPAKSRHRAVPGGFGRRQAACWCGQFHRRRQPRCCPGRTWRRQLLFPDARCGRAGGAARMQRRTRHGTLRFHVEQLPLRAMHWPWQDTAIEGAQHRRRGGERGAARPRRHPLDESRTAISDGSGAGGAVGAGGGAADAAGAAGLKRTESTQGTPAAHLSMGENEESGGSSV